MKIIICKKVSILKLIFSKKIKQVSNFVESSLSPKIINVVMNSNLKEDISEHDQNLHKY